MASLCRSCAAISEASATCPACGGDRLVAHDEVAELSLAHLDCDAFYATIEKRDDPSLEGKPVIVGGGVRGVVSTCCYIARAYGVRSAMPAFKAKQLCPHAVFVKPRMSLYVQEGRRVRRMMQALTPLVEPLSIDEAFMDLSGTDALHGGAPAQSLVKLQNAIEHEIGITVSIGLSFNKFLAKTASDFDKPRGFSIIGRAEALDFLTSRKVGTLPGVGPAAVAALGDRGLHTIGDLRAAGKLKLQSVFGDWGARLFDLANAHDLRAVDPQSERKSISAETTFNEDIADREELEDILWTLCDKVAARARASDLAGRTVTLKLRDQKFRSITRRRTLNEPTLLAARLFELGRALLAPEANGRTRFRLIGIGLADFAPADEADKGDMFDSKTPKRAAAENAVAKARERFGPDVVKTGRGLRAEEQD
jgi:DNA polymerase-4